MKTFPVYFSVIIVALTAIGFISAQNNSASVLPTALSSRIDTFVNERMAAEKLPGLSLVIVKDGQVRYSQGYGLANLEKKMAMTDRTRIAIGSTTKGMTALAVMQLVEQHKLDLDARVTEYLPWFKVNDARGSTITLRHLLSHTSGLPEGTTFDGNRDPNALEKHVRSLANTALHRMPGSGFEYANDGYAVAGLIVQVVSKMPYADYMTKFVFAPFGMMDATFDIARAEREGMAQGYVKQGGSFIPRKLSISQGIAPAGTLLTSARDVGRCLVALVNGGQSVISSNSLKEIWKPQATINKATHYGLGWMLTNINGLEIILHTGSVVVSGSEFAFVPSQRLAIAVLANFSNERVEEIGRGVATLLLGGQPEAASVLQKREPSTFKPDPSVWQQYVGDYKTEQGLVRLYKEGNRLLGKMGNLQFELEAYGDNDFVLRGEVGALEGHAVTFNVSADQGVLLMLDGKVFGHKK
jgi:CubicO group peptidase (beta-lactamase class C family)